MSAVPSAVIPRGAPIAANQIHQEKFVTFRVAGQMFGLPALLIQDIIGPQPLARVPLAPPIVAGAINLRGRIVTALDMHRALGFPDSTSNKKINVVVQSGLDHYDLLVDEVGDVLNLTMDDLEPNPASWNDAWRSFAAGIFKLDGELLVILNFDSLLAAHSKK
jgi:purine-binding chemotaxis protein CheW